MAIRDSDSLATAWPASKKTLLRERLKGPAGLVKDWSVLNGPASGFIPSSAAKRGLGLLTKKLPRWRGPGREQVQGATNMRASEEDRRSAV
ncbi:hypothetical protein MAE02_57990 [Microvirga aerophila]|uniref:Uncharacterized protein n=1 Tax=Microvirga aerophila TaxID=670291 RepID=A0A512C1M5_9HYPH|nr:hypothetical protein MAE02_57990 [Microvirga aerophila]